MQELKLDYLIAATCAATKPTLAAYGAHGDSGVNPLGDRPSPWARWKPGFAMVDEWACWRPGVAKMEYNSESDSELFEYVNKEEKEKEEKEKELHVGKVKFVHAWEKMKEIKDRERERKEMEADTASEISEITYAGRVVQVREDPSFPEPGKIRFLHRFQEKLRAIEVGAGETLGIGIGGLCMRDGRCKVADGYFSMRGGKILSPDAPVELLGLKPELEVVFQGSLRRGGFAGGRKGAGGGAERISCRCPGTGLVGTVDSLDAGTHVIRVTDVVPLCILKEAVAVRVDRVVRGRNDPNGRDQSYVSTGDPSHGEEAAEWKWEKE